MTTINAYIWFNGQCREAMNFYKDCLGGELILQTVEGSPIEAQCAEAMKGMILHASLTSNAMVLMGSDMTSPAGYTKGNNIALSLNCSSEAELNTFFTKLSAGGAIVDAVKEQFWGAIFGVCSDKYGITWMLNYNKQPASK
jgi:PhnB protein